MTSITSDPRPQAGTRDPRIALAMARDQFPNLRANGILRHSDTGPPIDLDDIALALTFLARCSRTRHPTVVTDELVRAVSRAAGQRVSLGAVIAAAVGLGFEVYGWHRHRVFYPHAITNIQQIVEEAP